MKIPKEEIMSTAERIRDFDGIKRWKRVLKKLPHHMENDVINKQSKEILIKKYKSKFPTITSFNIEKREIIQL